MNHSTDQFVCDNQVVQWCRLNISHDYNQQSKDVHILLKIIQISYLSNHNNYKIYINKPQSYGFFVGTMKGPHEYSNARDTLDIILKCRA